VHKSAEKGRLGGGGVSPPALTTYYVTILYVMTT
jgi:hypothetical protein